jgi:NhaP-type Na+/H+ or K+/H+ antiporter
MYENLAILAAFVFIYSLICGGFEKTPINGAIVFAAFGLVLGPMGLGLLNLELDTEGLSLLAELTLAMVLFTDAFNTNLRVLKKNLAIPQRLLLIGLPLTILLGFGAGYLIFDGLTLVEIAIIATMLAPTDAALGKAVVTNEDVPANISAVWVGRAVRTVHRDYPVSCGGRAASSSQIEPAHHRGYAESVAELAVAGFGIIGGVIPWRR